MSASRASILAALLSGALILAGCARRGSAPATRESRVGVVDLQTVTRAHPRWTELDAVIRQQQEIQAELALLPPVPPVPSADVQRLLDEEAKRLQAELAREVELIRQDGQRRLEAFADTLRSEQTTRLEQRQHELEAEAEREIMARRNELRMQLRAAEHDIREEYRFPLLNLRLRAEVAGLTSEQEGRELLQQLQALQQEREDRIRVKVEEMEAAFGEFQKAKEAEVRTELLAAQESLQTEFQQRLAAREQEMQTEVVRAAAEREREFRDRLAQRQAELLRTAEAQLRARQGAQVEDAGERARRLTAVLQTLREQQLRLEDSILAEVKIEVAAIAQERKLDVVLTRFVANVAGVDITTAVVEKLRR